MNNSQLNIGIFADVLFVHYPHLIGSILKKIFGEAKHSHTTKKKD